MINSILKSLLLNGISLLFLACIPSFGWTQTGKTFSMGISASSEREIGREFHNEAKKKFSFIKNPQVIEYINFMGKRIEKADESPPYRFRFYIINDPQVNAFAVPGGYIYIHSGLILKARTPDELAGVLAHEIAHIKNHHLARQVQKGTILNLATLAAIFLSQGNPAVVTGASAISQTLQLKYSREFEREADRFGLYYMWKAGYDPNGMISFFEKLLREQLVYPQEVPPYLLTHPLTEERINNLEVIIKSEGFFSKKEREDEEFQFIQALVAAETRRQDEVLRIYRQKAQREPENPDAHVALGIIYRFYGWTDEAIKAFQNAIKIAPNSTGPILELVRIYTEINLLSEAKELLEKVERIEKKSSPILYERNGDILIKMGKVDEAISSYKNALLLAPHKNYVRYSLALAYLKKGKMGEYHYMMGLYYKEIGEDERAISHLEKALREFGTSTPEGIGIQEEIDEIKKF
jgi:predicted Zn-dependent protease